MNKPHGAMDSASDFGSDGWGFESLWGCFCLIYMITFGIDNINFQILNKLVITDHKALSIEFLMIGKEN